TMPVDTHLLRIAPRIGLSDGINPKQVEQDLLKRIPESYLTHAHHWLVLHGRYICTARKPRCADCIIAEHCKKNGVEQ
ncbi:MAG TPA: endonuclease III, partial [Treponemataceae bacterium]|nr:endonuclease III [Treponemataceae bacterium]